MWRNHVYHERCYCVSARVHVVTMYLLYYTASVFCINAMYFYCIIYHCITNFVFVFLVISLLFILCCCFAVFGRVRLQNHFFYHSSLEGGGPFLY